MEKPASVTAETGFSGAEPHESDRSAPLRNKLDASLQEITVVVK